MKEIDKQIQWYEENATRKDDDLIKANLKLIDHLYGEIESSEDKIFLDKIIGTFCEILETQREVISELSAPQEEVPFSPSSLRTFVAPRRLNLDDIPRDPEEGVDFSINEFQNDKQLQNAFAQYCFAAGKSTYTVNDYCSRIKNLWNSFYGDYQNDSLPEGLCKETLPIKKEQISPNCPMLNALHHANELSVYVETKIREAKENRNWANTRAAFNKLDAFRSSLTGGEKK